MKQSNAVGKKTKKPVYHIGYDEIDTARPYEDYERDESRDGTDMGMFSDEKLRTTTVEVGGVQVTVKVNCRLEEKHYYDKKPEYSAEHTFGVEDLIAWGNAQEPDEEPDEEALVSDPFFEMFDGGDYPYDLKPIGEERASLRGAWFRRVCRIATSYEGMKRIAELMPRKANGTICARRTLNIATLYYANDEERLKLVAKSKSESEVQLVLERGYLYATLLEDLKKDVASTTDLFDFKDTKDTAMESQKDEEEEAGEEEKNEEKEEEKAKAADEEPAERTTLIVPDSAQGEPDAPSQHVDYDQIDTALSFEDYGYLFRSDKQGEPSIIYPNENDITVRVNGRTIRVRTELRESLESSCVRPIREIAPSDKRYSEHCEPKDIAKEAGDSNFWHAVGEYENGMEVLKRLPKLDREQYRRRFMWFIRACHLATTDESLKRFAELAPRKKDGALYPNRRLRIATWYSTESSTVLELVAKNESCDEIRVMLEDFTLNRKELEAIHSDVASTTNLFDFKLPAAPARSLEEDVKTAVLRATDGEPVVRAASIVPDSVQGEPGAPSRHVNYDQIDTALPRKDYGYLFGKTSWGEPCFAYPGERDVTVQVNGQTIRIRTDLKHEIDVLWEVYKRRVEGIEQENDAYYDLKGAAEAIGDGKVSPYDFDNGPRGYRALFERLPKLDREQVRRRFMWFVRACILMMTDENLKQLAALASRQTSTRLFKSWRLCIATQYCTRNGYTCELIAKNENYDGILVTIDYFLLNRKEFEMIQKDVASTTDLFDFKIPADGAEEKPVEKPVEVKAVEKVTEKPVEVKAVEKVTEKPVEVKATETMEADEQPVEEGFLIVPDSVQGEPDAPSRHVDYDQIDTALSFEDYGYLFQRDKQGEPSIICPKENDITVQVNGRTIRVRTELRRSLEVLCYWNIQELAPSDKWYIWHHEPKDVARKVGDSTLGPNSSKNENIRKAIGRLPKLEREQYRRRFMWFIRACHLATTDESLKRFAELAPRKKDGELYPNRKLRIATLYCAGDFEVKELIAKNKSDDEILVTTDHFLLNRKEFEAIHSDVASTTNLFDFKLPADGAEVKPVEVKAAYGQPVKEDFSPVPDSVQDNLDAPSWHVGYDQIDTALPCEEYAYLLGKDSKGETRFVYPTERDVRVQVNGRTIRVKTEMKGWMEKEWSYSSFRWNRPYYDLKSLCETVGDSDLHQYSRENGKEALERIATISGEQYRRRYMWFIRACYLATTNVGLKRLAELAPKQANGELIPDEFLHVATQYSACYTDAWELIAQNASSEEILVKCERICLNRKELEAIHSDVASTTNLFDFKLPADVPVRSLEEDVETAVLRATDGEPVVRAASIVPDSVQGEPGAPSRHVGYDQIDTALTPEDYGYLFEKDSEGKTRFVVPEDRNVTVEFNGKKIKVVTRVNWLILCLNQKYSDMLAGIEPEKGGPYDLEAAAKVIKDFLGNFRNVERLNQIPKLELEKARRRML